MQFNNFKSKEVKMQQEQTTMSKSRLFLQNASTSNKNQEVVDSAAQFESSSTNLKRDNKLFKVNGSSGGLFSRGDSDDFTASTVTTSTTVAVSTGCGTVPNLTKQRSMLVPLVSLDLSKDIMVQKVLSFPP